MKIFLFVVLTITSCSSRRETTTNTIDSFNDVNVSDGVGGQDIIPCSEGEKRACHVTLPDHEGVTSCFVGIQYCEKGEWTLCESTK